jgi:uncharacterized protein (TIGR02271 family)
VYDRDGERIGGVDDLFLDEDDRPEYIGVGGALIPLGLARVDDGRRSIQVAADRRLIDGGPTFDDEREITPDFEDRVLAHYGLERTADDRAGYGDYYSGREAGGHTGHGAPDKVVRRGDGLEGEDELRVQRSEEELRAGVRRREAGAVRVRKRVRTDRERIEVPTRREEVTVERVPVSGETTDVRIGEDEIVVPVTEEEVVVEKRPVVREEVRIRKDTVEDTEIVEEDVRREEIDVEDLTDRRGV